VLVSFTLRHVNNDTGNDTARPPLGSPCVKLAFGVGRTAL